MAFLLEWREPCALADLEYLSSAGTEAGVGDRASDFG
jgi:hypothetical protein